jgi:DNA-binding winged helix-turn-helix (wHTH) protein/predicted ATPase
MAITGQWSFGPFRLEPSTASLWRGEELISLSPKPLAVLTCLITQAGQVVTKDTLLEAGWPKTAVTEGVLKTCIAQIRQVLGETGKTPRYIATVHRRGYRFIAPVAAGEQFSYEMREETLASPPATIPASRPRHSPHSPGVMVGREVELARLQECWTRALQAARQVVLVTGEAGIGKTTVVDAFTARVVDTQPVWMGSGQCLEQYGAGEPYLPLLEAFGRLGRGPDGTLLVECLQRYAPTWLLQLPALVSAAEFETLQRRVGGTTRERMLRELAEAVEVLSAHRPLLLVLEDLHWSDTATLEWLGYVARRRDAAQLLVVGTYRPVEAIVRAHPVRTLVQELRLHGLGTELVLPYLPETGVAAYLQQRGGTGLLSPELARILHRRTSGNPLFLVTMVDELERRGVLRSEGIGWELMGGMETVTAVVPASLRQLIDQQLEQLPAEEQEILAAASVAGAEFSVAAVAAALEQAVDAVGVRCAALARRGQFVSQIATEEWSDGTVAARYGFLHDLYRETLYERVAVSRRVRWHRQIGVRLETAYDVRARELAAELAVHFVRGRDTGRAVLYLHLAGVQAMQRSAHQEALRHLTQGLELLATLPETQARAQQELDLHVALGPVLIATKSQAAPEVEYTYARARALCAQVGETPQLLPTLQGLCEFYRNRGALSTARELGEQLYRQAQRQAAPTPRLEADVALGTTLFHLGEYTAAWTHLKQGIVLTDPTAQQAQALRHGVAPGVRGLTLAANTLWCLGFPTQAVQRSQEALALAQGLAHPYSVAMAQHFAAFLHHRRRETSAVQVQAETLLRLATTHGFPLYVAYGTCYRGWALAVQGQDAAGMVQMRQGLDALLATGLELSRPLWLVLLAEVAGYVGQVEEGLSLVGEALTAFEASGRGDMLAEACRLQGELLLRQVVPAVTQAEGCFQQALAIARRQQAKAWELRAAISLSRLWQQQGKPAAASALLAPIYHWFTEGFDTADLQEARALLDAVA